MKELFKPSQSILILFMLFSASCSFNPPKISLQDKISNSVLDKAVVESLESNIDHGPHPDWTTACKYDNAYVKSAEGLTDVYVQTQCDFDYHTKDDHGKPIIGGVAIPVHMKFQNEHASFKLVAFEEPSDIKSNNDTQRIFPKEYLNSISQSK